MPPGLTTRSTLVAAVAAGLVASTPNARKPFSATFQPCSIIAILLVRADRLLTPGGLRGPWRERVSGGGRVPDGTEAAGDRPLRAEYVGRRRVDLLGVDRGDALRPGLDVVDGAPGGQGDAEASHCAAQAVAGIDRLVDQPAGRARDLLLGDRLLVEPRELGLDRRLDLVEADARARAGVDLEGRIVE